MTALEQLGRGLAALMVLHGLAASDRAAAQGQADLRRLVFVSGTCERLVAAGIDTPNCRGRVVQVFYDNGRISFAFTSDLGVVSFSGLELSPADDLMALRIDRITVAVRDESDVPSETAIGTCAFGDFQAGRASISCIAEGPSGEFSGLFVTDGRPPRVEQIGGE